MSRSIFTRLALVILAVVSRAAAVGADETRMTFYVATSGNDQWSGRLDTPSDDLTDGPFATISRARDAVRALPLAERKGGLQVLIRAGVYYPAETLVFGPEDGGAADGPVVYAAYPGETPVISGAESIRGEWRRSADGRTWSIRLPHGAWFEELFVNGRRLPRARMPNTGFWQAKDVDGSHEVFGYGEAPLAAWGDLTSGTVVVRAYQWKAHHVAIAEIDENQRTVTLARRIDYPIVPSRGSRYGNYYIENVLAALDEPGEWCLNRETGVLYVLPPDGVDLNRAEVLRPRLQELVRLEGDAAAGRFVEHLTLRGLTFRHSGRNGNTLRMEAGRHCTLEHCVFCDVGRNAVRVASGSRENRIARNEFVRIGGSGIMIGGAARRPGETPATNPELTGANVIEDNHIHEGGLAFEDAMAISLGQTDRNRVAHNLIHDMPYIGIGMSGRCVSDQLPKDTMPCEPDFYRKAKPGISTEGNVIELNHIHRVMQVVKDGAAIYGYGTTGVEPNAIHHNLIHDVGRDEGAVGIYLDDESDGYRVHDNVVYRSNVGLLLHGSPDNLVENNIFAFTNVADIWVHPVEYNIPPMRNVVRRNIWYRGTGETFKLVGDKWLKDGFWSKEPFEELDRNLYWRGGSTVELGLGHGFDRDSLVADPGFADPEQGDFSVKSDSPVFRIGFRPIDLSNAGPRRP